MRALRIVILLSIATGICVILSNRRAFIHRVFVFFCPIEKRKLYEKVEKYNLHLERLVEHRTLEIKKLHEDQKQAMIDISHNLQTPLSIIKGEIELLAETPMYTERLQNATKAIDQGSLFICELLHLAKLDHAAFGLVLVPLDLSKLILEYRDYFEVMAAEKSVRIVASISPEIWIVGHTRLLGELLMNLISNAIKYRTTDESKESVITISLSKEDDRVHLIVSDNGIGINAEDLPGIFTRFYRAAPTPSISGTGLGLAISKRIVEKHRGSISAESIPGKETSFHMLFPLYKRDV